MCLGLDLQNPLLYYKIMGWDEFMNSCRVGDTCVCVGVKNVITEIKEYFVLSIVINQDGNMETNRTLTLALTWLCPIYKYIGPTNKELQQKQENINNLQDFLFEARLKPLEQGCISFIGEDFREGREDFREGQAQE